MTIQAPRIRPRFVPPCWLTPRAVAPRSSSRVTVARRSVRPYAAARPGDIVLIAGKGHETGQEIDGVKHPFDDRIVVTEEIGSREERG